MGCLGMLYHADNGLTSWFPVHSSVLAQTLVILVCSVPAVATQMDWAVRLHPREKRECGCVGKRVKEGVREAECCPNAQI